MLECHHQPKVGLRRGLEYLLYVSVLEGGRSLRNSCVKKMYILN